MFSWNMTGEINQHSLENLKASGIFFYLEKSGNFHAILLGIEREFYLKKNDNFVFSLNIYVNK